MRRLRPHGCAVRSKHGPLAVRIVPIAFDDVPAVVGQRSDAVEVIAVHELTIAYDAARRENGQQFIHIAAIHIPRISFRGDPS
jgi:hypothetical protein